MERTQYNMRGNEERDQKINAFMKKIGRPFSKSIDELLNIEKGVYNHRFLILDTCHSIGGIDGRRTAQEIFRTMYDTYVGEWEQVRKRTFGVR